MKFLTLYLLAIAPYAIGQTLGEDIKNVDSGAKIVRSVVKKSNFRCKTNTCVNINIQHPAKHRVKLDRVAFMIDAPEIHHRDPYRAREKKLEAAALSREIADQLTEKFAYLPNIVVVSRENVERIFTEQNFSLSGLVEGSSTIDMGKFIGASTMIVVKVREFEPKSSRLTSMSVVNYRTSYKLRAYVQSIDFETGRITTSININVQPEMTDFSDFPDPSVLRDQAIMQAVEQAAGNYIPWFESKEMIIFKTAKYNMKWTYESLRMEEYHDALESAKAGYEEAMSDPSARQRARSKAVYNYGVVLYTLGHFKDAEAIFKQAWKIDNRKMYLRAIDEIKLSQKYSKNRS